MYNAGTAHSRPFRHIFYPIALKTLTPQNMGQCKRGWGA